ncbi:MAG: C4-type zinc ribbon domain-containing protein [Prevotellaceae bacterium]|nr:C4-type zinc ribbon domain-containing protein [Prevotellaceae bacterium]
MPQKTTEKEKETSVKKPTAKKSAAKAQAQEIPQPKTRTPEEEKKLIAKLDASKYANSTPEQLLENKLRIIYELQLIDSAINEIKILRGELPLEVQDLEDEVVGLQTRIDNLQQEIKDIEASVSAKKLAIETAKRLVKKYEEQQKNVRNNREFDSLSKEIEFQTLEVELAEKHIKEFGFQIKEKKALIDQSKELLNDRKIDLDEKQQELNEITTETSKEEEQLIEKAEGFRRLVEPRLLLAYDKMRQNAHNGLAVVVVRRDACGGCFNKIPPQRQLDIKLNKKVIVCEYCGRILVDADIVDQE